MLNMLRGTVETVGPEGTIVIAGEMDQYRLYIFYCGRVINQGDESVLISCLDSLGIVRRAE